VAVSQLLGVKMAGAPLFPRWKYTKRGKWIMNLALAITVINMGSFFVGDMILGGDAINGERKGDQFFVGDHGNLTEVTSAQWIYSYVHVILCFLNIPAIMGIYLWLRAKGDIRIERLGW
jgi:hypothetical protein